MHDDLALLVVPRKVGAANAPDASVTTPFIEIGTRRTNLSWKSQRKSLLSIVIHARSISGKMPMKHLWVKAESRQGTEEIRNMEETLISEELGQDAPSYSANRPSGIEKVLRLTNGAKLDDGGKL